MSDKLLVEERKKNNKNNNNKKKKRSKHNMSPKLRVEDIKMGMVPVSPPISLIWQTLQQI